MVMANNTNLNKLLNHHINSTHILGNTHTHAHTHTHTHINSITNHPSVKYSINELHATNPRPPKKETPSLTKNKTKQSTEIEKCFI